MKFTNGYWALRKGIKASYPAQLDEIEFATDSFTAYAPTKPLANRGDILNGTLLTATFASPMPDVIQVRLLHFAGQPARAPHFQLLKQPEARVTIAAEEATTRLTSGRLTVRVPHTQDWQIDFLAEGRLLTSSPAKGMGIIEAEEGGPFMHEQLALGVGECVYGLGERFTAFVKNGQAIDIWNEDGGTSSEQAYKNIPFYLTNRGYGVFVNHPGRVAFEVGSERVTRVQFSVPGQSLEYFVIYGPTPKEILDKYTALTGRPALPPAWSFGLWLTTSFTTSYDEATVTGFIQGMAERDLPLHVFHFDCFWMKKFNWCDFQWDPETFPDPPAMLKRLKERGLHICVWINPYIAQRSPLFAEGMQAGYLLKKPNGDVWQIDRWQPGMGIVDFTNPAACQWFGDKLSALTDMGVDCFKTDFGERIPTDVVYFDGADPAKMHNYYTYLYNKTIFEVLREQRGEGEAVVFARSATVGGQRFPVHWGGDSESSFASMAESLRGGLSLGLSGFAFWSHDIGGFDGKPAPEVYKRWIAFGLLSSHSRLHGNSSYRVPWLFDEEAVNVLRHFTKLKCRLMPYLFSAACEATVGGTPVMRAMILEFPSDPTCEYLDRQYMLGGALLVAPVFSAEGAVDYYLPAGRWTDFLTGEVFEGPGWRRGTYDFMHLPLMVRPNSIIPVGSQEERPDYDYAAQVTLHVYELADGMSVAVTIPTVTGEAGSSFDVRRVGNTISVDPHGSAKSWQLLLVGIHSGNCTEGQVISSDPKGLFVTPTNSAQPLDVQIA